MEIEINLESGVPIYIQIMDRIKHLVAMGRLQPGEQLPTIRQLAVELGVNLNTVARAYTELDREGVISTQQGRGCYVAQRPDEKQLLEMRGERLRAMLGEVLLEALSLGYQKSEIREVFDEQLDLLQRSNNFESFST
ncbi:MAG: GntR family transcriptional regulator [Anaerolineae bacterium]